MTKKGSSSSSSASLPINMAQKSSEQLDSSPSPSAFSFKTTLNPSAALGDPDNVLQAVVLADSFNQRFMPITLENPRCLLPLVNAPLIEYTFEFLAVAGVQEIFVFCCAHHQKIVDYLSQSKWTQSFSPIRVHTIVSESSLGVGDAMREIDSLQIIRSDFILLSGDIVSNMNLKKLVEEHKARRQKDKNVIMTMVVKEVEPTHALKAVLPKTVMTLDPNTQELMQYDIQNPEKSIELDMEIVTSHPEIQFRADLMDCEIDICSPEVLALFTENFDYQHMRRHFVKGILESDILGKKIIAHVISSQYAARVGSLPSYDIISKDVMKRWTYPLVPEINFMETTDYTYSRHHIYKDREIVLARSCVLEANVVVGKNSRIGEGTVVSDSVIGQGCVIGSGVTLKGAYLWDNVTVGDNCTITGSVLCNGVVVKSKVTIPPGCILSYEVVVGPNVSLPNNTRLTLRVPSDDDDSDEMLVGDDSDHPPYPLDVIGKEGRGYSWKQDSDDEDNDDNLGVKLFLGEQQEQEEDEGESTDSSIEEDIGYEPDSEKFHREAVETVKRSIDEKHTIDNTALEINALKFAYNSSFRDCIEAVLSAIFDLVQNNNTPTFLKDVLKKWAKLLLKFVQSRDDQFETILIIQNLTQSHDCVLKYFSPVLQLLYDEEVLEEDTVLRWYKSDAPQSLKAKAQKFVQWLEEAESEDSD